MKAGRKKHLSDDAEKVQVSLTPEENLVLQTIRTRRKKRGSGRSGPSQIVADSLWKLLVEEEKIPREYITRLTEVGLPNSDTKEPETKEKVREIRSKDAS